MTTQLTQLPGHTPLQASQSPPPGGGFTSRSPSRWQRFTSTMFVIAAGLLLTAGTAHASHFRGASLVWKKLASPANTIELTLTESWRTGSISSLSYGWGDGSAGFNMSGYTIIANDPSFTTIRKVITHTYSTAGPFTVSGSSCCRISNLVNAADGSESVAAIVDLRGGNAGPPVITSPIILQMVKGGVNNIQLGNSDVDGDTVAFRMATSSESQISYVASAGGKSLSVSSSGLLTWDTSSTATGQLWAVQVIANDNHLITPGVFGQSRVAFDFIIQIVDGSINHPPVASGDAGPFTAVVGQLFTNAITGTDQDGGNLTVTHQGLPSGATLTPASGTTAPQPLAATFSWTPTIADAGSSVGITIVFTDSTGLQANKSFAISVPSNQPPVANAGPDQTIYDIDGNDTPINVVLNGTASSDPEHVPLTYSWTQTGGTPAVVLANFTTATPSFPAPSLHIHPNGAPIPLQLMFRLDVSDGKTTRSDDVLIIVKHNNLEPTAVASAPVTAPEGTTVTLDGSASTDPDQDPLSYLWTQISGTPVGLLTNATNDPTLNFGAAVAGPHSIAGEMLEFTLTVSDGIDSRTSAVVPVFIKNVNIAPLADAGHADPTFDNAQLVTLNGMGFDPDGDPIAYSWTQIAGPPVTLQNSGSSGPTFITPPVSIAQGSVTLTFQLVVNDANAPNDTDALNSAPSTVDVLVKHANRAPIAAAGPNKDVPEQNTATLDGSGSYDPDNDAIATYQWTQTGGVPVVLDTTDPIHPTFTTPDVNFAGATLTFQLVVTDTPSPGAGGSLSSAPSAVVISVKYVNRPPQAVTSAGQSTDEGGSILLDGSQSSDPDGNAITYAWTQVSGPAVGLSDAAAAKPTFVAPQVDRFGATIVFALKVTDEFGAASNVAQTSVIVRNVNHAPVTDAGETQSVPENTEVTLPGLAFDADTEEQPLLTYAWQQTGGPSVTLAAANTTSPTFHAPTLPGGNPLAKVTLKFKLTATDPNGAASSDEVEIIVANVDHSPIANAGGITIANEAQLVTLDGSLSSDPDGDSLTYAWVQTSGPTVTLANSNTAAPSFTAPFVNAAGATLKFKLTVNDGFGATSCDTATVSIVNINDAPVATNAQASVGMLWPPNHQMVPISIIGIIDPNNNATVRITKVTQDEPTNGLGDGDTAIDAIINANGTVLLRAERSGKGDGRVYRISFTVSDFEGSASGIVKVGVQHNKKDTPVDSGASYDSTK